MNSFCNTVFAIVMQIKLVVVVVVALKKHLLIYSLNSTRNVSRDSSGAFLIITCTALSV